MEEAGGRAEVWVVCSQLKGATARLKAGTENSVTIFSVLGWCNIKCKFKEHLKSSY